MTLKQWLRPAMVRARLKTWRRPSAVFLSTGVADEQQSPALAVPAHDQALLAWRDWCAVHAGQRCRVGLSSQWLLHAIVPIDQHPVRAQAVAEAWRQWGHYFNIEAQASNEPWRVQAVKVRQAWLVGAMPRQIVADLQAVARAHGVAVLWMGPWWAHGGQRWLAQRGQGSGARHVLLAQEPGWCVGLAQADGALSALWASQAGDEAASLAASVGRPCQVRIGEASAQAGGARVLWDDAVTRDLLEGRASAWIGVA